MDGAMVVWIVLIITTGVVVLTSVVYRSKSVAPPPEQVLKDRFARGEIGEQEYVRRLAVLHHDRLELTD